MTRPVDLPDWATDATFSSGPIIGQPNKDAPSAGMVAEGFDPTDPLAAEHANFLWNNHGAYISVLNGVTSGNGFLYREEWLKTTIDTEIWTLSNAGGSGDPTVVDDNAAGGYGALSCDGVTGTGSSIAESIPMPPGTRDFYFSTYCRRASTVGGTGALAQIGVYSSTAGRRAYYIVTGNSYRANDGTTTTDTGVTPSTSYQFLEIARIDGELYFWIDGTLEHSVAHSVDLTDSYIRLAATNTGGADGADFRFDVVSLWINR